MTKFYKLLMAIVFAACCAFSGWAYDFEEGGLYYNISGTNVALATGDNSYEGDIVIPATVEHDGVTYNVTTVGTVFKNNTTVTKLKLPSSVTTLPESCFAGMTGLLELEIPNVATLPNYLCDGCTALTTLILGEGVHLASCHMTRSCNSLNKVYMLYEDVLGWDSPSGGIGGSTIPAQYKPIANNLQAQSTLYIPNGTTDAYKTKKNIGYGTVTLWNKFGSYVELPPPGGGVDVESITITPANPVLAAEEGATVQLTATVLPEDATDKTIVWSTSDANVATVSNTGLVTRTAPLINDGDQPYTVTITANGANDVSASVTITAEVLANIPVSSIAISPENPVLAAEAGATVQLTATVLPEDALDKTITWSSANETVATVNANGLVTRVAPLINDGDQPFTVNITATAASGVTQTVTVTAEVLANIPVTSVTITPENPVLAAENGATVQLTATPLPENALDKTITWSSADETIATVNASGLVTRVAPLYNNNVPFTVNITATAASGVTQTVTVTAEVLETVYPTALSISPADPVLTAEAGSTVQLTAVFDPETTTERTVTWNSADETVATVDANGLVTRTAPLTNEQEQPYTVVITATTPNGLSANVTVTANIKGDEFFYEDGLYYNVLSHDDLTVEVTNSKGGTGNDIDCYSGDIEIPVTVTHKGRTYQVIQIGNYAFGASGTGFSAGTSVTSLKLNEGLRNIASYGIRGMGGISELVLPSTITHLVAFALGRISAETIVIPNAAEIEQSALSGCTNLKHLILGAGVQNIGNNFTNGVTGVEDVTCLATTPPVWDGGATNFAPFAGFINNATLYVPEGCIEAYRNAKATYSGTTTYYWRFGTIEEYVEPAAPQRVHITETEHGTIEADNMNPEDGATVTLTVTPETGYSLESISAEAVINPENSQAPRRIDGPSVGVPVTLTTIAEGQTYTFVMPDAPYEVIITTVFALTDYTITVAEGIENGTVAADKQTANYGEAVNVTVTPAAGYELATLTYTVEGEEPVDIVNNTFNMPAANVTINATFSAIDYTITVDDEIENGTVEADKQTANIGETVTLTITPAEGYSLGSLTVLNGETTVETTLNQETGEYTFTMPAANVTVTATFTNVDYTITVVDGIENGTVEAPATAHFGETVNVTVTPATGYQLASLTYTVEGEEAVNIENNTFNMPAANVTINATFSMINYTITVDNEIENGTVEAPATANYGDAVNVTVTPDTGYQLASLTYTVEGADPVNIENNTFNMPAANVTINATFSMINYTITVDNDIENGEVTAPATANYGDAVNVTVTPATGYQLASLTYTVEGADPVNIENNTFNMPAANVTINATFSMINYTITVDNEIENGEVTAPATANYGETVTLTVTPAEGYQLKSITVTGVNTDVVAPVDEDNKFVMPADDVTVTAEFELIPVVLDGVVFDGNAYATWFGNADLALPEGVTAYVVTAVNGDKTQIEAVDYIPANVGVLLYSTTSAEAVSTVPYTGETATVTSMLQGSVEDMEITDGYVLYNDAFVLIKAGTLAAHRCYLPVTNPAGAPMRLSIVRGNGVVTAITDVRSDANGNVRYIDMNGRVSDRPFNGINIVVNADGTVTKMVK